MPGFDLNAIIQQAALVNNQQAEGASQSAGLLQQASQVATNAGNAIKNSAQYGADATRTELEYQLRTESQRLGLANAFGTNQGAASDVITGIGQEMRQTGLQLIQQQNKVADIEAGSDLINNPVGWLRDLLQGDGERAKLGALQGQFDRLSQVNQNLNAATQQGVATQNAIKQTVTQDSIDNVVKSKVAAAEADAAQMQLEGIKYQIQGVQTLANVGADAFSRNMQVYNAALQAEAIADNRENRKLALEQSRKEAAEKQSENEYFIGVTDRIKKAAALTGRSEVNLNPEEVARTYKSGGPRSALFQELEQIGFGLEQQGGSAVGLLGKNTIEAAGRFASIGGRADTAWTSGSLKVIERATNAAKETLGQKQAKGVKVTPEMLQAEVQGGLNAIYAAGANNVSQARDDYNALPNLSTIVENKEKILNPAGRKFADTVAADIIAAGNDNPEAELVLATGIKWVKEGKLTQKEWKEGMLNFYQAGLGLKSATGGYSAFAMPMPDSYRINANRISGDSSSWFDRIGLGLNAINGMNLPTPPGDVPRDIVRFDLMKASDYDTIFTVLMSKDRANKILQGAQQ